MADDFSSVNLPTVPSFISDAFPVQLMNDMVPIASKLQPLISPKPKQSNSDLIRSGNLPSRYKPSNAQIQPKVHTSPSRNMDEPVPVASPTFNSIDVDQKSVGTKLSESERGPLSTSRFTSAVIDAGNVPKPVSGARRRSVNRSPVSTANDGSYSVVGQPLSRENQGSRLGAHPLGTQYSLKSSQPHPQEPRTGTQSPDKDFDVTTENIDQTFFLQKTSDKIGAPSSDFVSASELADTAPSNAGPLTSPMANPVFQTSR